MPFRLVSVAGHFSPYFLWKFSRAPPRLSAAAHACGVGSVFGVDVWTPRSAPAPVVKLDLSLAEDVRVLFLLLSHQALAAVHLAPPAALPSRGSGPRLAGSPPFP